jgi:hypothetical protein
MSIIQLVSLFYALVLAALTAVVGLLSIPPTLPPDLGGGELGVDMDQPNVAQDPSAQGAKDEKPVGSSPGPTS